MGLYIHGEKTGKYARFGYTQFNYSRYALALRYCDCPKDIGFYKDKNEIVNPAIFLMFPCIPIYEIKENDFYSIGDDNNFRRFLNSIMLCGNFFPNLLFHSDCDGYYSKRGKVNLRTYETGNSIKLLDELNLILNDNETDYSDLTMQVGIMTEFRELVKYEIENGNGKIYFG